MPTGCWSASTGRSEGGDPAVSPGIRREDQPVTWSTVRVGAALLVGLVVLTAAVFFLDEIRAEATEGEHLFVTARDARGLEVGAQVWLAGVPAGWVEAIRFRSPEEGGKRVLVSAVLEPGVARTLRADASATIRSSALLAPVVLSLKPGTRVDRPFSFSDTLTARPQVTAETVMARADSLRDRLRELRPRSHALARRLEEGPGTLAELRRHPATLRRLTDDARRTEALLSSRRGSAGRLMADTALRARARRVAARLRTLVLRQRQRAAPPGAEAASLTAVLDSLDRRARRLETGLDSARGTAGRILHDRAIHRQLVLLRARQDSLRHQLLGDLLRWIRFRLF